MNVNDTDTDIYAQPHSLKIADGTKKVLFRSPSEEHDMTGMTTDICHEPGNISVLDGKPSL